MKNLFKILPFICLFFLGCNPSQKSTGKSDKKRIENHSVKTETATSNTEFLKSLVKKYPQYFDSLINRLHEFRIQIIYSQIDRDENGKAKFTDHFFNLNDEEYFYPASTVKLPIAILALQKLNELNVPGLDMNTSMITEFSFEKQTEVYNDPSTTDGRPTIASYIKKILLVSDNDAFNRLYEFLGQEYINENLYRMRYREAQIIHRLEISMTEEQNRHTNPVVFIDSAGNKIYEKKAEKSKMHYANRSTKMGKGFYREGKLINAPFDFSKKNRLCLQSLHSIVRSIMFPDQVPYEKRFNLTIEDYKFLQKYMSMMPGESDFPYYDSVNYWDNYVKFLYYGAEKNPSIPGIRIFNKVGDAYGFLIDASYIVDFNNNIEFQLSAVIHCNKDQIFNDNKYEYDAIGFPFMKNLGTVLYNYELTRKRKHIPDLDYLKYQYKN